jgi:hypothetical protein
VTPATPELVALRDDVTRLERALADRDAEIERLRAERDEVGLSHAADRDLADRDLAARKALSEMSWRESEAIRALAAMTAERDEAKRDKAGGYQGLEETCAKSGAWEERDRELVQERNEAREDARGLRAINHLCNDALTEARAAVAEARAHDAKMTSERDRAMAICEEATRERDSARTALAEANIELSQRLPVADVDALVRAGKAEALREAAERADLSARHAASQLTRLEREGFAVSLRTWATRYAPADRAPVGDEPCGMCGDAQPDCPGCGPALHAPADRATAKPHVACRAWIEKRGTPCAQGCRCFVEVDLVVGEEPADRASAAACATCGNTGFCRDETVWNPETCKYELEPCTRCDAHEPTGEAT